MASNPPGVSSPFFNRPLRTSWCVSFGITSFGFTSLWSSLRHPRPPVTLLRRPRKFWLPMHSCQTCPLFGGWMDSPWQAVLKVVFIPVTCCLPNLAVVWKRGWMPPVLWPTGLEGGGISEPCVVGSDSNCVHGSLWRWCNNPAWADHFLYLWIHRPRVWRLAVFSGIVCLADVSRQLRQSKVRWGEPQAVKPTRSHRVYSLKHWYILKNSDLDSVCFCLLLL